MKWIKGVPGRLVETIVGHRQDVILSEEVPGEDREECIEHVEHKNPFAAPLEYIAEH